MTIQIDDRKGSAELKRYFTEPAELCKLEYADFAFHGNGPEGPVSIGIERKSIRDLVSSISTGRLSGHQLIGLVNSYDYVIIVFDGPTKTGKDGYMRVPKGKGNWAVIKLGDKLIPRSYIDNYLYSLWVMTGVSSHYTGGPRQTAQWIEGQYKWWNKKWSDHSAHLSFYSPPPKRAMFQKPSLVHRMIKEIDKVGWNKGLAVSKKFRCMADIVLCDVKDLEKVDGIGRVLAHRIMDNLWGVK